MTLVYDKVYLHYVPGRYYFTYTICLPLNMHCIYKPGINESRKNNQQNCLDTNVDKSVKIIQPLKLLKPCAPHRRQYI